jgi:hypothetical protein
VVINNLDVARTGRPFGPLKADPPLVIDPDAILALPMTLQCFQSVAGQGGKVSRLYEPHSRADIRLRRNICGVDH